MLNAGATIGVGDITVGGGMREDASGAMQIDVGALVAMGALSLSAGWGNSDSADVYALAAGYPLGEGVQLDVQVDFGDAGGSEWIQFLIGTAINF